ncbi:hypothetical protein SPRG_00406 [Saprolegnia parasitica CBS 223.65]|uniref:WRKY19-like zinc finger domain-containing protein n=1 Tax=Saprolegnia parasitica (strain CBS 223.65) TaxID=695850 RepID=A0A067DA97_SAPPC|nr:hypothetical protein SPRG_00406 [Saprolegnia parasitica CBS 223.65]KDO35561.1 hypothetical protein SPRG_00406 [Saprolegnia parasitica CBS 223.65]|eukprot:XP_012193895.1 hypothetical protein SPRG_00406 [Saprolegnia parasitica CBS 223.65]
MAGPSVLNYHVAHPFQQRIFRPFDANPTPLPSIQKADELNIDCGTFEDLVAYTLDHEEAMACANDTAFDSSEMEILYGFLAEQEATVHAAPIDVEDDGVITLNLLDDTEIDKMLDNETTDTSIDKIQLMPPAGYIEPAIEARLEAEDCLSGKNRRLCKMEGCQKRSRSHGLCIAHGGGRRCAVDGCNKSSQGGNLCIKHGGGKRCEVDGCERAAQSNMLCKAHGGGPRCLFEGCDRSSQGSGYCRSHGGGKRCLFEGCDKGTQRGDFCALHGGSRLCGVAGCMRNDRGGGFCATHGGGKRCAEPGCIKPCRRNGRCSAHWRHAD